MALPDALTFRYDTVPRDLVCAPETIAGLGDRLDQLGVQTAMLICGPTIDLSPEQAGLAAADAVAALCRSLGLPARLRDVDVPESGLEHIAAATLHDRGLATNPKPITDAAPILRVLRQAW